MAEARKDLLRSFQTTRPEAEKRALDAALAAAALQDAVLYLVGGPVRDLLLGRPSLDIDIAVEGDVPRLAEDLEAATGHRVVQHGRFGTATLRGDGFTIDLARARRETYARPGSLPEVEAAGIEEDLARRDFTINAMALRLSEPAGLLLDPFGGQDDVRRGLVRVLHEGSFQDDATRMIRACRYADRLGFQIDAGTARLVRRDLSYLDTISGPRLRQELTRAFKEPSAPGAAASMESMAILSAVHPLLSLPSRGGPANSDGQAAIVQAWTAALQGPHLAPADELGFCVLSACRSSDDVSALSARLHLTGRVEAALRDLVRLGQLSDKLDLPGLRPSQAVELLETFAPSAVWALALKTRGAASRRCLSYLEGWRRVRPALNGRDLQELGMSGSAIGAALKRLRRARLDGEVHSRIDEDRLIEREFLAQKPSDADQR